MKSERYYFTLFFSLSYILSFHYFKISFKMYFRLFYAFSLITFYHWFVALIFFSFLSLLFFMFYLLSNNIRIIYFFSLFLDFFLFFSKFHWLFSQNFNFSVNNFAGLQTYKLSSLTFFRFYETIWRKSYELKVSVDRKEEWYFWELVFSHTRVGGRLGNPFYVSEWLFWHN